MLTEHIINPITFGFKARGINPSYYQFYNLRPLAPADILDPDSFPDEKSDEP
jgi:hypothetical protein